jgi:hypothetical protein
MTWFWQVVSLLVFFFALSLGWVASAEAQVVGDPCLGPAPAPQEVPSGAPFSLTWTMAQSVPKSETDQTMVPHRYSGFGLALDGGPRQDIGLPPSPRTCPNGTARAGDKVYEYKTAGVARGSHTYVIEAWNHPYLYNADGSVQTNPDGTPKEDLTKQNYGVAVSVPFGAVDVTNPAAGYLEGPPFGAFNVWIIKSTAATGRAKPIK